MYYNGTGDVENPLKGWLQGLLLVKVIDNETVNQSSDKENNLDTLPLPHSTGHFGKRCKSTKKTVSQLWSISTVSPCMIAYAATLLRFILSDGLAWGADDSFPYKSFYNGIVDFFEDVEVGSEDETCTKQLLTWLTRTIYGSDNGNAFNSMQPLKNFKNSIKNYQAAQKSH
ncbi:hypothetical protein C8R42DRAFT_646250 [Lentinula raphanica]|nr:hypothetical protein C8R42DRAFT_646250 [Lentinula raphanica]